MSGEKREQRELWVIGQNGKPVLETGYSCAPMSPDSWWFPMQGFSTGAVYESEAFALADAARDVERRIGALERLRGELAERLAKLNS